MTDPTPIESNEKTDVWYPMHLLPNSEMFWLIYEKIRAVPFDQSSLILNAINNGRSQKLRQQVKETYKVLIDWQNSDQSSFEMFRMEEDTDEITETGPPDRTD